MTPAEDEPVSLDEAVSLDEVQRRFIDRLFSTGGVDPGPDELDLPPERFAVYLRLVRGNYRSMIEFAFPTYTDLLVHLGSTRGDELGLPETMTELVAQFLQVSPARTHSTREIADRFTAYIAAEHPGVATARPEAGDLIRLERAALETYYAADDPGTGADQAMLSGLGERSVEEFLGLEVLRAPSAALLSLEYPVLSLTAGCAHGAFPESPARESAPEWVSLSRHPVNLRKVIQTRPASTARLLGLLEPGAQSRLEGLAEQWLAGVEEPPKDADGGVDEAALFTEFATAVATALGSGFFRLA